MLTPFFFYHSSTQAICIYQGSLTRGPGSPSSPCGLTKVPVGYVVKIKLVNKSKNVPTTIVCPRVNYYYIVGEVWIKQVVLRITKCP